MKSRIGKVCISRLPLQPSADRTLYTLGKTIFKTVWQSSAGEAPRRHTRLPAPARIVGGAPVRYGERFIDGERPDRRGPFAPASVQVRADPVVRLELFYKDEAAPPADPAGPRERDSEPARGELVIARARIEEQNIATALILKAGVERCDLRHERVGDPAPVALQRARGRGEVRLLGDAREVSAARRIDRDGAARLEFVEDAPAEEGRIDERRPRRVQLCGEDGGPSGLQRANERIIA